MAFYSFYIFPTSDFASLDFGDINNLGSITTGSSFNPITVTVDDDDGGFTRGGFDSTPGTIVSADPATPSIIGATVSSQGTGTNSANYEMDALGGSERLWLIDLNGTNYVISTFMPEPNTTYTEGTTAYSAAGNYSSVVCYAPGTMIDTPDGPQAVETLQPGDLVMTLDHGPQPIRWTRSSDHPLEDAEVDAKPVQIKAGALGRNLPIHDLIVSPQHRVLVGGYGQLQRFFETEAFAPAKSLTSIPGIRHMKGKTKITWVHFACDRHEVVTANGCLSESLLLGPIVLNGLSHAERQSVTKIFGSAPTQDAALNGSPARDCMNVGAVRKQLAKSYEKKEQPVEKAPGKWDAGLAIDRYEVARLGACKAIHSPSLSGHSSHSQT